MAWLCITHRADRPLTELSGGERQLVLVARALAERDGPAVLMRRITRTMPSSSATAARSSIAARLREAYGIETVIGVVATPGGPRRVCAPMVLRSATNAAGLEGGLGVVDPLK